MSRYRVLVVFPDNKEETATLVCQLLQDKVCSPDHEADSLWVKNEAEARAALDREDYHLIICDVQIPVDSMSLLKGSEGRGLHFLQSLQDRPNPIPSLLVTVSPEARLFRAAQHLQDCEIVLEDETFQDEIAIFSRRFLFKKMYRAEADDYPISQVAEAQPQFLRKIANIEITLNIDRRMGSYVSGQYYIEGYGYGFIHRSEGELLIDYDTLLKLIDKSKELEDMEHWPDWEKTLLEVGETLGDQIYDRRVTFKKDFEEVLRLVEGIENTRIRFKVKPETYGVILEALTDAEEKFLMLQAPIYRRIDISYTGAYPLFTDPETREMPINCLIIEAEASGYLSLGRDHDLDELKGVRDETDWLLKHLQEQQRAALANRQALKIGRILRLTKKEVQAGEKFSDSLKNILARGAPWHLMHFAGHSLYDEFLVKGKVRGEGYFIFPGAAGQPLEAVKVSELSPHFRKAGVRFLYLSSCSSAEADFAFQLANNFIPAILGFRWPVADDKALHHTRSFYRHLFQLRSVDEAFLQSRRDLHQENAQDRTWAAPLLIMQVSKMPYHL